MDEKQKQLYSKHLAVRFSGWIQEGDPKFIKLWSAYAPYLLEEDKKLTKEDGGGGGFGGDAGAGTVFTSTDSGVFSPTYGGSSAKRRTSVKHNRKKFKKKKTGIERLGAWMTDYSPERKSLAKGTPTDFALDLLMDVTKEYRMKDPNLRNKVDTK